jgi:nucleotide-binding universal stress UspA family protein
MKKILVITDFSSNSKAGIRFAIQLANQEFFELIFYNVNVPLAIDAWTQIDYNNARDSENSSLKNQLNQLVKRIYKQTKKNIGKIDCVVENNAEIDASIIAYAKKRNVDFICMSTRGGGIADKFMGTNASSLITTSPIPLIVVPHTYRMKPLKSVLYASDMENIGMELKQVEKFASLFDASIGVYNYDYFMEEDDVKSKFRKIADKYNSAKVTFHFKKLYAEVPLLNQLQDDIRKSKPSIIAMFTKQDRSWFERLFLSSKTAELGFDTKTPMLVFRKHKAVT